MAFSLSPAVSVAEFDLTTVIPAVATSSGALAGVFRWGPIDQRILVTNQNDMVSMVGKPTNFNAETWFTGSNFLDYSNRLFLSRAADTVGATPVVSATATGANNIFAVSNTTGLSVGMYLTQCSNAAITFGNSSSNTSTLSTVSIVSLNSSSITLSSNATAAQGSISLYFARPETVYTAVAFDSANTGAKAANLVNQIVKNNDHYTTKDGTFDPDIVYLAKYPGALGNSLRISVCDNANSYSSTIPLANASVNTAIAFSIGSNTAQIKFLGATNASANAVGNQIAIGDYLLAGNSTIGIQYLYVTGMSVTSNTTASVSLNGNTDVNSNLNFITVASNPLSNGDVVAYANATGNTVISGLSAGNYYVVQSNTSGFKLSATPYGDEIDITATANAAGILTANVSTLSVTFQDPYRLRDVYVANTVQRNWEFFNVIGTAPGQSTHQLLNGNTAAQDELHVVVVDDDGLFSGVPGTVLEAYTNLSRATDAKSEDGTGYYYKNVINDTSKYVWWARDRSTALSNTARNLTTSTSQSPLNVQFVLGADGRSEADVSLSVIGAAYDLFASPEEVDVSLIMQGKPIGGSTVSNGRTVSNFQLANYLIDNISGNRRDCVAFITPDRAIVTNNRGGEALALKDWRGSLRSSSYAFLDSGYKYQYDKYNDVNRWIPLNGDMAGLCARTDQTNDVFWAPAGYNRGQVKNIIKLAWSPRKAERDILFPNGINPVITEEGEGTILLGDKTLQFKPSSFDAINVRRLFITLEKAIATSAKYTLFEFNDPFTRSQFKNMVNPYLRSIKGRRGITEFLVKCDESNNTADVLNNNGFVADIYIKPARAIRFIKLNFVNTPEGVQFSEVISNF